MRGDLHGSLGSQMAASHRCANRVGVCLAALVWLVGVPAAGGQEMLNRFVYLHDVDATILQDMRYATANNFTGHVVPGYAAPECVLVREAADALKAVQAELTPRGLSLKVYDCYRPARAVAAFVAWAKKPDDPQAKAVHYPALDKAALFPGYIATRSGHSRGATIDLTLAAGLTQTQRANRALLVDAMRRRPQELRQGVVALYAGERALPRHDLRFPDSAAEGND
jgi:D-alanyl-D-alanine dipeptidase